MNASVSARASIVAAFLFCGVAVFAAPAVSSPGAPAAIVAPNHGSMTLSGSVRTSLGSPLAAATIRLLAPDQRLVSTATADSHGDFRLRVPAGVRSSLQSAVVEISAPGFATERQIIHLGGSRSRAGGVRLSVTLHPALLHQHIVVVATGVPTPAVQLGQPVSVVTRKQLQATGGLTTDAVLRLQTGVQVTQTGQIGGLTTLSLRGGDASFIKIFIDGVPVQRFDYGAFDFSTLLPGAIQQMQIVRGPDSVLYGSDAMSGVLAISSRSGRDVLAPELDSATRFGSFSTAQNSDQLLGFRNALDYGFGFDYLDTHNEVPNSRYHDAAYHGNVGWRLSGSNRLRLTSRYTASHAGQPNAILLFGMPDDSFQQQGETYSGLTWTNQTSPHWQNRFTVSLGKVDYLFDNPSPTGTPYDPYGFGANYLGNTVTIQGANGYSVTGQAYLDYGGVYPQVFSSDTVRRDLAWNSLWAASHQWTFAGGYRYYDERGLTANEGLSRHDNGVYGEINGKWRNRLFGSAGISADRNTPFGATANPQGSLAYIARAGQTGVLAMTRLRVSGGTALEDPNIFQQGTSLYDELQAAGASSVLQNLAITPIHPQRSRAFDAGIDQYFFSDRVRLSVSVFDQHYYDLIEYVPSSAFALFGLGAQISQVQNVFGANLNSLSERSRGMEWEARWSTPWNVRLTSSFTHQNPVVLHSLSSDAVAPAVNPAFPNIPIGAYSPLVGARPFRVAPDSGSFDILYSRKRWTADANADFASRRDDSTFLSDPNFGPAMLLPNHDLAPAYQLLNLSGTYRLRAGVILQAAAQNLLDQHPQQVFGYPGLGTTVELGIRFRFLPKWPR